MKLYKASEFAKKLGVSVRTLGRLEEHNELLPIRKNNHRYYSDEHFEIFYGKNIVENKKRRVLAYYRVSSNSQKSNLKNQLEYLENYSINSGIKVDEYLFDIGSGINFKRKNFLNIINQILNNEVDTVLITYKDRITRFGFELFEWICQRHNTKIEIINLQSTSVQEELVEDLMTIIHVFSARLYGLRKYKKGILNDISQKNQDF